MYDDDVRPYGVNFELHHYTSFDGALGILSSNTIRATDAARFKDSTELVHGLPVCYRAIRTIRDRRLLGFIPPFLEGLRERFRYRTYVSCFSTRVDIESQWSEYADRQRGFAITFDNLRLSDLRADPGLRLMPVEYGPTAQERRARRAVVRSIEDILAVRARPGSLDFAFTAHARFALLAIELFYHCSTFKSWDYRREREWRLIYTCADDDDPQLEVQQRPGRPPFVAIDLTRTFGHGSRRIYSAMREGPRTGDRAADVVRRLVRESRLKLRWEKQGRVIP